MAEAEGEEPDGGALRPEERLGAALRTAREQRGLSLRALAKRLFRAHSLGRVFCELRRFEDAIDCEERSLAIAREVGHCWGEARSLEVLGIALLQTQGVEAAPWLLATGAQDLHRARRRPTTSVPA